MQRQAETGAFAFDAPVGGKITFPANAFVKPDGSSVTGNITVSAKDILKASDMLLANKPNLTSNSEMLEYFGEIMMKASQKNTALRLNPGVAQRPPTVVVPVDTATGANREAYCGKAILRYRLLITDLITKISPDNWLERC